MLKKSRSMSGLASLNGSTNSDDTRWSSPVLGDAYRFSRSVKNPLLESLKKTSSLPKTPRPNCTMQIFQAVKKGIKYCMQSADEDLVRLKTSENPVSYLSAAQHMKLAERFKKRLETHLVKIKQLEENYILNLQLWEGAKTMAKAYISYSGRKSSPQSIDCGVKECVQTLCAIEASLEALLGSFDCTLRGLFGFARLMPGDAFDVCLRYGHQKWKSRGKIGVTNQSWDPCVRKLKASINDHFSIKATEVKLLGKHVMLGETNCETMNLFSAKPSEMLINLNSSSSLRLGLLVKWNPLEGVDESSSAPAPTIRVRSSPGRRQVPVRSMIEGDGQLELWNVMARPKTASLIDDSKINRHSVPCFPSAYSNSSDTSLSDNNSFSSPTSSERSEDGIRLRQKRRSSLKSSQTESSLRGIQRNSSGALDKIVECSAKPSDQNDFLNNEDVKAKWRTMQKAVCGSFGTSVSEFLQNLKSKIERLDGKYTELNDLEKEVNSIEQLIQMKKQRHSFERKPSDDSVSIENALEAFNFLDSEDCPSESGERQQIQLEGHFDILGKHSNQSPESTSKTTDSGIESIANHLDEDETGFDLLAKIQGLQEAPCTGSWQVDAALNWHLHYCTLLLNNLDTGVSSQQEELACQEKLVHQTSILSKLTSIALSTDQEPGIHELLNNLTAENELQQFWLNCIDSHSLLTSTDNFLKQLFRLESHVTREYMVSPRRVFDIVLSNILDTELSVDAALSEFDFITLHQFIDFFAKKKQSVLAYVLEVAAEVQQMKLNC